MQHLQTLDIDLSSHGSRSVCSLARRFIGMGVNPETLVTFYRGNTRCFEPMKLGTWAGLAVVESENGRWMRFKRL